MSCVCEGCEPSLLSTIACSCTSWEWLLRLRILLAQSLSQVCMQHTVCIYIVSMTCPPSLLSLPSPPLPISLCLSSFPFCLHLPPTLLVYPSLFLSLSFSSHSVLLPLSFLPSPSSFPSLSLFLSFSLFNDVQRMKSVPWSLSWTSMESPCLPLEKLGGFLPMRLARFHSKVVHAVWHLLFIPFPARCQWMKLPVSCVLVWSEWQC